MVAKGWLLVSVKSACNRQPVHIIQFLSLSNESEGAILKLNSHSNLIRLEPSAGLVHNYHSKKDMHNHQEPY